MADKTPFQEELEKGIREGVGKYTAVITAVEVMKSFGVEEYDAKEIYKEVHKEFKDITLEEVQEIIKRYKEGK